MARILTKPLALKVRAEARAGRQIHGRERVVATMSPRHEGDCVRATNPPGRRGSSEYDLTTPEEGYRAMTAPLISLERRVHGLLLSKRTIRRKAGRARRPEKFKPFKSATTPCVELMIALSMEAE